MVNSYSKFVRDNNMLTADLDGELCMLNSEQGKYFCLNSVGSRIWELLESPKSAEELVKPGQTH